MSRFHHSSRREFQNESTSLKTSRGSGLWDARTAACADRVRRRLSAAYGGDLRIKSRRGRASSFRHRRRPREEAFQKEALLLIDDARTRLGITECVRRELLQPHPVLYEKEGEIVAQMKFCVLLMPKGPLKITGIDIPEGSVKSEKTIEDEGLIEVLKQPIKKKKDKKAESA